MVKKTQPKLLSGYQLFLSKSIKGLPVEIAAPPGANDICIVTVDQHGNVMPASSPMIGCWNGDLKYYYAQELKPSHFLFEDVTPEETWYGFYLGAPTCVGLDFTQPRNFPGIQALHYAKYYLQHHAWVYWAGTGHSVHIYPTAFQDYTQYMPYTLALRVFHSFWYYPQLKYLYVELVLGWNYLDAPWWECTLERLDGNFTTAIINLKYGKTIWTASQPTGVPGTFVLDPLMNPRLYNWVDDTWLLPPPVP